MPPVSRIVLDPINGLERAFAQQVAELQAANWLRQVVVLTGETLLHADVRRRVAELNGAHLNVHVVTPGELSLRLGEVPLVLAGRRPLPLLADRVLAQQAALDVGSYFNAVGDIEGSRAGAAPHAGRAFVTPSGQRVLVGRIELALRDGKLSPIDFKTDDLAGRPAREAAQRHVDQLQVYRDAVVLETGGTVDEISLVLARTCERVRVADT